MSLLGSILFNTFNNISIDIKEFIKEDISIKFQEKSPNSKYQFQWRCSQVSRVKDTPIRSELIHRNSSSCFIALLPIFWGNKSGLKPARKVQKNQRDAMLTDGLTDCSLFFSFPSPPVSLPAPSSSSAFVYFANAVPPHSCCQFNATKKRHRNVSHGCSRRVSRRQVPHGLGEMVGKM